MANTHLACPDLALNNITGTGTDQDAESFFQLFERKIKFLLGGALGDADEIANYTFREKAFFSLLRGPAVEWYHSNITKATTWGNVKTILINRFSWVKRNSVQNGNGTLY